MRALAKPGVTQTDVLHHDVALCFQSKVMVLGAHCEDTVMHTMYLLLLSMLLRLPGRLLTGPALILVARQCVTTSAAENDSHGARQSVS